jgi:hypothetical protein
MQRGYIAYLESFRRSALSSCSDPHDHLAGKFHPATAKLEIDDGACVEATQAAMEVAEPLSAISIFHECETLTNNSMPFSRRRQ